MDSGMKRKREAPFFSSVGESQNLLLMKRRRDATQEESQVVDSVVQRIVRWLSNHHQNLPQDLESLQKVIQLHGDSTIHVSEEIVFYHLLFNGAVEMQQLLSGEKVVKGRPDPKPFHQFIAVYLPDEEVKEEEERDKDLEEEEGERKIEKEAAYLSDDFIFALERARNHVAESLWMHAHFFPLHIFLESLKQVCLFQRGLPSLLVIESLVKRGFVQMSQGQSITYCLPALTNESRKCKYVQEI
eukprot:CAMPEP_0201504492 /NCGR_PEP_ID=MMETSP0151_2-20130828/85236_1 /ASSEMBLY_ACC=CAM_ASM_000257 /TAXON_ID=200890 /ORGANISM="Paramoeba atlantica, Strain 621/1 / CCAP 1560/9" /LENGTH=242 /DNA_ID=CAMNT_0047898237 /DNA_START=99 /DNA_END=827 /DNA_ORIENTATION=+